MSKLITFLIFACVASGVALATVGERLTGAALMIFGVCVLGVKRKFDITALIEDGGVPDATLGSVGGDSPYDLHASHSHDSGGGSDGSGGNGD